MIPVILMWGECQTRALMIIAQHWFRQWLGAIRQQAITWANVDPDICRHMASLGHNELTHCVFNSMWYMTVQSLHPPHNEVVGGVHWFHLVRLSVPHPVSALLRLQFWLDPFYIYTSYQATPEGVECLKFLAELQNYNFWQFFKICNFDFVFFWLGIWCESLVWVIIGRRGVSQNAGILVGLGNGLLTDGIKPLPEQMLTYQVSSVESIAIHINDISTEIFMILIIDSIWKGRSFHKCREICNGTIIASI